MPGRYRAKNKATQNQHFALTNHKIARITIFTAVVLFLSSLACESYCTDECGSSFLALLLGWSGMLLELGTIASAVIDLFQGKGFSISNPIGSSFAWLANPLFFLSLIALKRDSKRAIWLSVASLALMLSFMLIGKVVSNEAGGYATITAYKAGYWLWLSSPVVLMTGAWVMRRNVKQQEVKAP